MQPKAAMSQNQHVLKHVWFCALVPQASKKSTWPTKTLRDRFGINHPGRLRVGSGEGPVDANQRQLKGRMARDWSPYHPFMAERRVFDLLVLDISTNFLFY